MTDWPSVTVVVPFCGEEPNFPDQLRSLAALRYDGELEVLLVDNGATAQTRAVAASSGFRIVEAQQQQGISFARNAGARAGRGDLLAFCDADDEVHPRWVEALAVRAETADLIGGHVDVSSLNPDDVRLIRGDITPGRLPVGEQGLAYATGCNLAIWRSVFDQLDGFDERLGPGEDVDLGARAHAAGLRTRFAADAVVAYRMRVGWRELSKQGFGYGKGGVHSRYVVYGEVLGTRDLVLSLAKGLVPRHHALPRVVFGRWLWAVSYRWGGLTETRRLSR